LFIGILRDLGFVDQESAPTKRYYEFLDRSQSARVIAQGVREAFSDLFAINKEDKYSHYRGSKEQVTDPLPRCQTDNLISRIASTFTALSEYGDFTGNQPRPPEVIPPTADTPNPPADTLQKEDKNPLPHQALNKKSSASIRFSTT